jgi:hypothetical protein
LVCASLFTGCFSEIQNEGRFTGLPVGGEEKNKPPALTAQTRHAVFPVQYMSYDFGGERVTAGMSVILPGKNPREYLHFVYAGETVYLGLEDDLENPGRQVKSAYITDQLFTDKGEPVFDEPLNNIPVEFINNKARFTVPDISPLIQQTSGDGNTLPEIRAFELHVDWGDGNCVYFFSFRSGPVPQQEEEPEEEPEIIRPGNSLEPSTTAGMSVYQYAEAFNFPGDENAQLILYTSALPGPDGAFMFDDGQDWALVLRAEQGSFNLLPRQFIQLGQVAVTIFTDENTAGEFHVLVTVRTGADIEIVDFAYDEEQGVFIKTLIYDMQNINAIEMSR